MTYFLKKKKWMAWVVLLTFLFTSFMPSNILAGNSVAEAASKSITIFVGEQQKIGEYSSSRTWNIRSGKEVVSLSSNNGKSVTVTGLKAGTAKIRTDYYGYNNDVWTINVQDVKYFILDPEKVTELPSNGNDQGVENYYPNASNNGGVENCNEKTGYKGGTLTSDGYTAVRNADKKEIFAQDGVNANYYTAPSNLGRFSENRIVWYVIKIQTDGIHVDGYVADIPIAITYVTNFDDDKTSIDESAKTGNYYTVKSYEDTTLPSRPGYTFTGWNTKRDGSGECYTANSVIVPRNSMFLYAQWSANADKLSYNANGGTGTMSATEGKVDEKVAVAANKFTRAGYTFTGWNTKADGSGTSYAVNEKYTLTAEEDVLYAQWSANTDISYTVEYRLRDENGRKLAADEVRTNRTMASTVTETAKEIAGYTVDKKSKSLKLEASGNKIVFLYDVADGTGYKVERYYQNLDGSYSRFETINRTTTTSQLAFLEDSDKVWSSSTTPGTYVFNPNAKGTVDRLIVAADGSTVLKAFFDLRVKVQYYYTDGTTAEPKLIAETAPLYKLGSAVNVPLMDGLLDPNMDFSNLWYTDATIKNSWNFDTATISGDDLQLIDGQYVLVLYTSAKVKPLATGDVVVQKIVTGNAPTGEVYNFTMDITANTPNTRPQLGDNEASQLNLLTTAEIQSARAKAEAEGQWESAKKAFKANALQVTTDSGLKFVMTDDRNNTLFGITSSSALAFEYDEYTTFTFEGDAAEESLLDQIISFFKGLTSRPDENSLVGLRDAVVTSGSALSFHVSDADNVYTTYQAWQKAEEEHAKAAEELYKFQVDHGLVPSNVKVQVTDQDGNMKEYTLGKDIQADENGVYTLTFGLKAGDSCGFKFIAATGSAITFDIHENYSNDSDNFLGTNIALGDQENIIARDSQSVLNGTTGSQYIFINNFRPVGGGNGDGGDNTGGGDGGYDGPYSDDPSDNDTIIDDPDVPLTEPDVDDTDDGIAIDDGDVPLTDVPGEAVEIGEPQVPLGDAPKTGDANNAIPFVVLMMMAGLGLVVTRRKFN